MSPAFPVTLVATANQSQIGLVDQGSRGQGVPRFLLRELHGGEPSKFVVHQRQQSVGGGGIAAFDLRYDLCDVGHGKCGIGAAGRSNGL